MSSSEKKKKSSNDKAEAKNRVRLSDDEWVTLIDYYNNNQEDLFSNWKITDSGIFNVQAWEAAFEFQKSMGMGYGSVEQMQRQLKDKMRKVEAKVSLLNKTGGSGKLPQLSQVEENLHGLMTYGMDKRSEVFIIFNA